MLRVAILTLALAVLSAGPVHAQERKAYKYVDEKGNITYSQTPPVSGRDANKIDISPANAGRGGVPPYGYSHSHIHSGDRYHNEDAGRTQKQRAEEEEKKRLADLAAECTRS